MPSRACLVSVVLTSVLAFGALASGCRGTSPEGNQGAEGPPPVLGENGLPQPRKIVIAFLGDSITAGYGLTSLQAYPAKVEELFHAEGYQDVEVMNAGISGDTTAGGRQRIEQVFVPEVKILVVALGGNDALRGLSTTQTRENLAAIIDAGREHGLDVLLAGMQAPTNYGEDYQVNFKAVFAQLAREYRRQIAYVPFLLEGVAGMPALNQPDGIHPTAEGQKIIAQLLYAPLRDLVDQVPQPAQ